MSLILEALRRADAERQRGAVPGLHAQTGLALPAHGGAGPQAAAGQRWLLLGAVGAVLLGGLGALAWVRLSTPASVPVVAALPAAAPAALPIIAAPAPAPAPATQVAAAPAPALPTAQAAAPVATPAAVPMPRQVATAPLAAAPLATAPLAAAPLARAPAAQRAAPITPQRLPTLAELPDTLRRDLPAMTLGGSMYAQQPALRMVIINGQVVHEGDRLAPELVVQQIRQKSVVLNWRGQAFELGL